MPEVGVYISKVLEGILGDEKPSDLSDAEFAELLINAGLDELKAEAEARHGTVDHAAG